MKDAFTLIELMIVIAIIAIIAAIAIPNLRDARIAANETSAIAALRAFHSAQNVYREQDKDGNGTLDFSSDKTYLVTANLLPDQFSSGEPAPGYNLFGLTSGEDTDATLFKWSLAAWPREPGNSGRRYFYINQNGVIRYSVIWPPGPSVYVMPPIGK